jgi:hypothetical protein
MGIARASEKEGKKMSKAHHATDSFLWTTTRNFNSNIELACKHYENGEPRNVCSTGGVNVRKIKVVTAKKRVQAAKTIPDRVMFDRSHAFARMRLFVVIKSRRECIMRSRDACPAILLLCRAQHHAKSAGRFESGL